MNRIVPLLRTAMYALRGGFLVRPLLISIALGLFGALLSSFEEAVPALSGWVPALLFPSRSDPQVAQIILGAIAASIMTVVSIVFAILLMTLTLASMQFSPRILVSFVRDRVTQWTLGIFLGTFAYCMAALPAARSLPHPFAPVATVAGAMLLALSCVAWLMFFIQHISQAISVNHIVDRIARETEDVIDEHHAGSAQRDIARVGRACRSTATSARFRSAARCPATSAIVDTERLLYSRQGVPGAGAHAAPGRAFRSRRASPCSAFRPRNGSIPSAPANCSRRSTSDRRGRCSRTSSSGSSRSSTSRSGPFRPRSTTRARR